MSPPRPTEITPAQFAHLLSLYPSIVKRVYEGKIKDSNKLAQALDDDAWRYDGLVKVVAERRSKGDSIGGWLEKPELEKLVRWKITHGTNRPFLPAQVRKNEPSAITSATAAGFKAHPTSAPLASTSFPTDALNHLTTLTGVGPATATLLLSIADPTNVPFFQDELFHWLCNEDGEETKLKYSMKEYRELLEKVGVLRGRLRGLQGADEVEKVGFVVGHLDMLDDGERQGLQAGLEQAQDGEGTQAAADDSSETKRELEKLPVPVAENKVGGKARTPKAAHEASQIESSGKRKRKAPAAKASATPTRKSQRTR